MKFLTLNTHSWLEIHQIHKIKILADFIVDEQIDVVALQEINQNLVSAPVDGGEAFLPATDVPLKESNFAFILMKFIQERTGEYRWSWGDSHEGWNRYDEGLSILSRIPVRRVQLLELSEARFTYTDVFRRCALAAEVEVQGKSLWVASVHMNWWLMHDIHLFEHDFAVLDQQMRDLADDSPIVLLGDFNNDAAIEDEGYRQILQAGWHDAFELAQLKEGEFTVHKKISGWESATREMRIDFVFSSEKVPFEKYTVVFPDNSEDAISDHSGIVVEIDAATLMQTADLTSPQPQ